ncbi:hypothetical protein THAOC_18183, partial [Thalassiosira oceanica]
PPDAARRHASDTSSDMSSELLCSRASAVIEHTRRHRAQHTSPPARPGPTCTSDAGRGYPRGSLLGSGDMAVISVSVDPAGREACWRPRSRAHETEITTRTSPIPRAAEAAAAAKLHWVDGGLDGDCKGRDLGGISSERTR